MYHEAQLHDRACFITLTYAKAPATLEVWKVQRFLKKLRKHMPVRYFLCGEYGEKTGRPHYHMVLFGGDFRGGSFDIDGRLYGNEILNRIWRHGDCVIGEFSMASACYVAGYVNKKMDDSDTFTIMSRRPPIGYDWAVRHQDMLQRREKVVIEGNEYPIPKVYLHWEECTTFRQDKIDLDNVKANRLSCVRSLTDEQLRNKEINQAASDARKEEKL